MCFALKSPSHAAEAKDFCNPGGCLQLSALQRGHLWFFEGVSEASFPSAVPKALSIPVQPRLWILWRGVMVAQMAYSESC